MRGERALDLQAKVLERLGAGDDVLAAEAAKEKAVAVATAIAAEEAELGGCGIRNSWTPVLDLRPSRRDVRKPPIRAPLRQVFRDQFLSRGRALQARRGLLVRVVEGQRLR